MSELVVGHLKSCRRGQFFFFLAEQKGKLSKQPPITDLILELLPLYNNSADNWSNRGEGGGECFPRLPRTEREMCGEWQTGEAMRGFTFHTAPRP